MILWPHLSTNLAPASPRGYPCSAARLTHPLGPKYSFIMLGSPKMRAGLSVVFWAFLLAPALCAAGVLVHECDCGESDACGHEEECCDDPCSTDTLRPADSRTVLDKMPTLKDPVSLPFMTREPSISEWHQTTPTFALPPARLPYPPSDRPLLV